MFKSSKSDNLQSLRSWPFWLMVFAFFMVATYALKAVLLPFVLGAVIAYFLHPTATKLEQYKIPRWLGTILMLLIFFACIIGFVLLLVPVIQAQIGQLIVNIPLYLTKAEGTLSVLLAQFDFTGFFQLDSLKNYAGNHAGKAVGVAGSILGTIMGGGAVLLDLLTAFFITPIVAFFLLRDWPKVLLNLNDLLPRKSAQTIRKLVGRMDESLGNFMRGQALVCLILAVYYGVGLSLVGLESGLSIGIFVGVVSFIPYLGFILGGLMSIGLAFLQFSDPSSVVMVAAIFGVGQLIEGNYLSPKIIGESLGIHPLWIMFSLLVGGALLGFLGVLLALPLLSIIMVLVKFLIEEYKDSKYYKPAAKVTKK